MSFGTSPVHWKYLIHFSNFLKTLQALAPFDIYDIEILPQIETDLSHHTKHHRQKGGTMWSAFLDYITLVSVEKSDQLHLSKQIKYGYC